MDRLTAAEVQRFENDLKQGDYAQKTVEKRF